MTQERDYWWSTINSFDDGRIAITVDNYMARRIGRIAGLIVGGVFWTATTLTYASQPGDAERGFLKEAAAGNLRDVVLVRWFGGYVAIPRTLELIPGASKFGAVFSTFSHPESSLGDPGRVMFGRYVLAADGQRIDLDSMRLLSGRVVHTERRGQISIDYCSEGGIPIVLVYDKVSFIRLTGKATALTNEFVKAFFALSGPPDIVSGGWKPSSNWADLPVPTAIAGAAYTTPALLTRACERELVSIREIWTSDSGRHWRAYVEPGAVTDAFSRLGFSAGDAITAVDGIDPDQPEVIWNALLRSAEQDANIKVQVQRNGHDLAFVVSSHVIKQEMARCRSE